MDLWESNFKTALEIIKSAGVKSVLSKSHGMLNYPFSRLGNERRV